MAQKKEKKNNPKNSGNLVPLVRLRAAHALRSDQLNLPDGLSRSSKVVVVGGCGGPPSPITKISVDTSVTPHHGEISDTMNVNIQNSVSN